MLDLRKKGIENAAALLGGMDAWKNAGLPVDKTVGRRQSRSRSRKHFPFVISHFSFGHCKDKQALDVNSAQHLLPVICSAMTNRKLFDILR